MQVKLLVQLLWQLQADASCDLGPGCYWLPETQLHPRYLHAPAHEQSFSAPACLRLWENVHAVTHRLSVHCKSF